MTAWNPITSFTSIARANDSAPTGTGPATTRGVGFGADLHDRRRTTGFGDARAEVQQPHPNVGDQPSRPFGHAEDVGDDPVFGRSEPARMHKLPESGDGDLSWPGASTADETDDETDDEIAGTSTALEASVEPPSGDQDDNPSESSNGSPVVPFYKRELSFGRKKQSAEPAPETDVETDAPADDEAPVPFYKRELSLRRRKKGIDETPTLEHEQDESDHEAEVVELPLADLEPEPAVVELPLADPEPEPEVHAAATEEDADAGAEITEDIAPVASADAEPEPDAEHVVDTPDDAGIEDAPEAEPVAPAAAESTPAETTPFYKRDFSVKRSKQSTSRAPRNGRGGGRVVGLKIGASQISAAVMVESAGRQELAQLARTSIEPGVVVDGEVRDVQALGELLRTFFEEHKLPRRDVRIGLASNRIGVRTLDLVGIDDEERFRNAVRFKAHEVLPMAMTDSTLDYRVLADRLSETGESIKHVLLAVAPRDQVDPFIEAATVGGLHLRGIDLEALGLLRAFVDPLPFGVGSADAATVIVNVGHESSTLLVAGAGTCEFTRAFDWGGATLQAAIAQELDVHVAEAATILRHISLVGDPTLPLDSIAEDTRNRAVEVVRLRLAPFARELVSSLQYYQTQPGSLGIEEIVITGGTSALEGLAETLHQVIGVPVRVGDPFARIVVQKGVDVGAFASQLGSMSVAIGLAVEDGATRSVNLLPGDAVSSSRVDLKSPRVLVPAAIAVPIAAVALLFVGAKGSVSDKESQLAQRQADLAALPQPTIATVDPSLQGEQATRASTVANVLTQRLSWDVVLGDLSRVLPKNVWLSSLKAQVPNPLGAGTVAPASPTPGVPVTPSGVTIMGYTYSQVDVARLLARLATLPSLTNVQLQTSAKQPSTTQGKKEKTVVQFTVLADLKNGGTQ